MALEATVYERIPPVDAAAVRKNIEEITRGVTVSGVARRALELASNPDTSLLEIGAFISRDPELATRVLKTINSVIYGFPRRISSVNQALLLLGLNAVRGVLWNLTVFDLMKNTMVGLWEHSAGCAIVSRLIAKRKGFKDPEDASLYGLLHDMGKTIFALRWPKLYAQALSDAKTTDAPIRDMETVHFNVTHAIAGAWLAGQWSFPTTLVEVIKYHHAPQRAKEGRRETAIAHVADIIVRARGFGFAGDIYVPAVDPGAWELLGLSDGDLRDILSEMEDLMEEAEALTV